MGLYPPGKRDGAFGKPTIVTRRLHEETLMPTEDTCRRLVQLAEQSQEMVHKFTPRDWKTARGANLDQPAVSIRDEPAGHWY